MESVLFFLLLVLIDVHRPFVKLSFFSLKPFMIGMVIVGGVLILRAMANRKLPYHFWGSPIFLPVAVFILIVIIGSTLQAKNISRSYVLVMALLFFFFLYLMLYQFTRTLLIKHTLFLVCMAGALLGLISIATYVLALSGVIPALDFVLLGSPNLGEFSGAPRMIGLNNDPNLSAMDISVYLMVSLSVLTSFGLDKKVMYSALLCSVLAGVSLLATLSRGGILGVLVGIAFLLFFNRQRVLAIFLRNSWKFVIVGVCFTMLFLFVVPRDSINSLVDRMSTFSYNKEFNGTIDPIGCGLT